MRLCLVGSLLAWALSGSAFAQLPAVFDSFTVERSDTLYFDFGSADLRPAADSLLRSIGDTIRPGWAIYLTGHTDAVGSPAQNEQLARRRVARARDTLRALGWPDSLLRSETFGERRLLAPTPAAAQRNRRVTVDLMRPATYRRLSGQISDAEGKGQPALIAIRNATYRDTFQTDERGMYQFSLPDRKNYRMDVFAPGFFFHSRIIRVRPDAGPTDTIALVPATPGRSVPVRDLFFVGNDTLLLFPSIDPLATVTTFLRQNPDLRVEIGGHVNHPLRSGPLTTADPMYSLSQDRANMVRNYLIARGIHPDRLRAKGYLNTQMRFSNPRNEEEASENRRVEITVIE